MPVRVLVAEADPVLRAAVRTLLNSLGGIEVVAEAASGDQTLIAARRHRPDVVVCDARPGCGIRPGDIAALCAPGRRIAVLLLTAYHRPFTLEALEAGAAGVVLTDEPVQMIAERIRSITLPRPRHQPSDATAERKGLP